MSVVDVQHRWQNPGSLIIGLWSGNGIAAQKRAFPIRMRVMKIVYQARDIIEAHIVSGMLASEGIDAHVDGYYLQGAIGSLPAQGFSNVTVDDRDVEAALVVIREYERN